MSTPRDVELVWALGMVLYSVGVIGMVGLVLVSMKRRRFWKRTFTALVQFTSDDYTLDFREPPNNLFTMENVDAGTFATNPRHDDFHRYENANIIQILHREHQHNPLASVTWAKVQKEKDLETPRVNNTLSMNVGIKIPPGNNKWIG